MRLEDDTADTVDSDRPSCGDRLLTWFGTTGGAAVALAAVIAAQLLVGTTGGEEGSFVLDRPYYLDQFYYAGIARAVTQSFPPQNPTFAGEWLRQHAYHLVPLSILAKGMSPFLAMRLLNVAYALLILLLLRRYLPRSYGAAGCALFAAFSPWCAHDSLAVDLAERGFHHGPFVALALIAMLETRRPGLRVIAALALPVVHVMMAVGIAPGLLLATARRNRPAAAAFLLGLAAVALLAVSGDTRDVSGFFWSIVGFNAREPLRHLIPLGVALLVIRPGAITLGALGAAAIGAALPWNRFFFLFGLNLMLALAVGRALASGRPLSRWIVSAAVVASAVFFGRALAREAARMHPFDGRATDRAVRWIDRETPAGAVFLQAPTVFPWSAERTAYHEFGFGQWVMPVRNLYSGAEGWADSVGLRGTERNARVVRCFRGEEAIPPEVDYVFYGPMERLLFPRFDRRALRLVYRDAKVRIYRTRTDPPPPASRSPAPR